MSAVSIGSDVLAALQQFNESYAEARASTGEVERPPQGEWNNILKEVKVEAGQEIEWSDGQKFPAFRVQFRFTTLDPHPPEASTQPLEWPGKAFLLPIAGIGVLPGDPNKGRKAAMRMETERLKGYLTGVLGDEATNNLAADLQALVAKVNGPEAVALRVGCQYDKTPKGTYFKDFFRKKLSE